jgi:hypothetical protein
MNLNLEYINDEPLEAALSFLPHSEVDNDTDFITGFELGANWQQERMYSEEEVLEILESFNNGLSREEQLNDKAILSHLEQFKKK